MFFSLTAVCEPGDPSKISPELSEAGKDKIRRNIHVIDDNMDKINENLSTIEYNIGVLSKEIATLDGFRDEHLELKKRYETYLEEARKVKNKNDFSLTQLEEKHQAIKPPTRDIAEGESNGDSPEISRLRQQLEMAKAEARERNLWEKDADKKISKVESLLKILANNLQEIKEQKRPLVTQLSAWESRKQDYLNLKENLKARKSSLQNRVGN